jgi:hypothetical protein
MMDQSSQPYQDTLRSARGELGLRSPPIRKKPMKEYPTPPQARGPHHRVRSRAPLGYRKTPQPIPPGSLGGSGATVGYQYQDTLRRGTNGRRR